MVSFLSSSAAAVTALLASLASTEAAYGRVYWGSRPSVALGSRMMPLVAVRPPVFSRDFGRIMGDFDEMFEAMLGDVTGETLYEPLLPWYGSRQSRLLREDSPLKALVRGNARDEHSAKHASGIIQDENQVRIAVKLPDSKASDIDLRVEEDSRLLTISGETKRTDGGIVVRSRFERTFHLPRDVDMSKIAARMNGGVLTITAPKIHGGKEKVRKIDIVSENEKEDSEDAEDEVKEVDASMCDKKDENRTVKSEPDESVIDLDLERDESA